MRIIRWWKRWRQGRAVAWFNSGYDYAAGKLLRSNGTAYDRVMEEAHNPFVITNSFDMGMREACLDWSAMLRARGAKR